MPGWAQPSPVPNGQRPVWATRADHEEERTTSFMKFEITEEYNPPSSWDHMAAVRDLVTASLVGKLGRRTVAAFEQTSRANLESIGQIRVMVQ